MSTENISLYLFLKKTGILGETPCILDIRREILSISKLRSEILRVLNDILSVQSLFSFSTEIPFTLKTYENRILYIGPEFKVYLHLNRFFRVTRPTLHVFWLSFILDF